MSKIAFLEKSSNAFIRTNNLVLTIIINELAINVNEIKDKSDWLELSLIKDDCNDNNNNM